MANLSATSPASAVNTLPNLADLPVSSKESPPFSTTSTSPDEAASTLPDALIRTVGAPLSTASTSRDEVADTQDPKTVADAHTLPVGFGTHPRPCPNPREVAGTITSAPMSKSEDPVSSQKVVNAHQDRHSILRYLSPSFGDADKLLDSMAVNRIYISGSRALEYFVPGSTNSESDWDFYTPDDESAVGFAMYMQSIGVKWETAWESLVDWYNNNGSSTTTTGSKLYGALARLAYDEGRSLSFEHDLTWRDEMQTDWRIEPFMQRLLDHQTTLLQLSKNGHVITVTTVRRKAGDHLYLRQPVIANVFNGVLQRQGVTTKIQLIQEDNPSMSFKCVFSYHSSCVQAVIGPFSAVHFYHKITAEKTSHSWPANLTGDTEVSSLTQKYVDRGYRYPPVDHEGRRGRRRHACDSDALFVQYDRRTELSDEAKNACIADMQDTTWYEYADATILVQGPAHYRAVPTPRNKMWETWFASRRDENDRNHWRIELGINGKNVEEKL